MISFKKFIGRFLYGFLFLLVVPFILWFWSKYTTGIITWPAIYDQKVGAITILGGVVLMIWGMVALMYFGKGLPMNPYPPREFVAKGPYRFLRHPIYTGFAITIIGFAFRTGSASLLWLVAPVTILSMIALVIGYEHQHLQNRFPGINYNPIFGIIADKESKPTPGRRFSTFLMIAVSALLTSLIIFHLKFMQPKLSGSFSNDHLKLLIILVYVYSPAFIIGKQNQIRKWMIATLTFLLLQLIVILAIPGETTIFNAALNKNSINTYNYFLLLLIPNPGLIIIAGHFLILYLKGWRIMNSLILLTLIVTYAVLFNISVPEAIIGLSGYLFSVNLKNIWKILLWVSEKLSNSWKEWVFGPVRIINYGFYIGGTGIIGSILIGLMIGTDNMWGFVLLALFMLVISALWAQVIEGSEKLKRPFGFYGGVVGLFTGAGFIWLLDYDVWTIVAGVTALMPWIQAGGRLRCLVNGCCHGKPVKNPDYGIICNHPRSRIAHLSELRGVPLHPTQLYSISWLFVSGLITVSLWYNQLPATFILGMYLILTGIGRFVEEAYRGEVQTPVYAGLRLYQWIAVTSIGIGIFISCFKIEAHFAEPVLTWQILTGALLNALVANFAMGVDFPKSNARFSRLV